MGRGGVKSIPKIHILEGNSSDNLKEIEWYWFHWPICWILNCIVQYYS